MTPAERRIAVELGNCSFLPGSWDKRFCRSIAFLAEHSPEKDLTEAQTAHLLRMAHKYRRQITTTTMMAALDEMERNADRRVAAGQPALPDFSKTTGRRRGAPKRQVAGLPSLPLFGDGA